MLPDPDRGKNVRSWFYGLAAAALAASAPAQAEKAVPLEWNDRGKHPFMMAENGEMAFGVVCSAVRPKYGSFDFVVITKRGSIPLRKGGEVEVQFFIDGKVSGTLFDRDASDTGVATAFPYFNRMIRRLIGRARARDVPLEVKVRTREGSSTRYFAEMAIDLSTLTRAMVDDLTRECRRR